jgi:ABC-type spermidine/putrescine transport system permease subunit I
MATAIAEHVSDATIGARVAAGARKIAYVTPALLWVCFLVLIPNIFLLLYSLWQNNLGTIDHVWNIENYRSLFGSTVFQVLIRRTVLIAIASAAIATLIAYPLAYLVVRKFGRFKTTAALLILVPLWVSYLMRVFAWRIILGESGVLNSLLKSLGVINHPSGAFLYSTTTVIMTLTYVAIPYVFLASYTALERVPAHLYEASGDCGASAWRTFWNVVWPLTRPGVAVGFGIGFVLAFGDYVTPSLVGGLSGTMLGSIVLQEFGTANDWPFGAAIAITILATGMAFLALVSLFTRLEAQIE